MIITRIKMIAEFFESALYTSLNTMNYDASFRKIESICEGPHWLLLFYVREYFIVAEPTTDNLKSEIANFRSTYLLFNTCLSIIELSIVYARFVYFSLR